MHLLLLLAVLHVKEHAQGNIHFKNVKRFLSVKEQIL